MSKDELKVIPSPTKLNAGGRQLTSAPILITITIITLVVFAIFYAASTKNKTRTAQNTTEDTHQEKQEQKQNNNIVNDLFEKFEKTSTLTPKDTNSNSEKNVANNTNSTYSSSSPQPLNSHSSTVSMEQQNKEEQRKYELAQKALFSKAALELKIENKKEKTEEKESIKKQEPNSLLALKSLNPNYLQHDKTSPLSKYELKAGWMIPAILITGINSDLSGEILAQVAENVYDSATGRYLLIPQGTKLVGAYTNNIIYGQERVLTAWTRLIYPNGDTLDLSGMNGTSADGMSGFNDLVNNHYLRIFGSAFLLSSITAGVAIADNPNGQKETSGDRAMASAIDQMSTVASEMIRKNMNIAPTIEIRPGYKFNIFVSKDIILEPVKL